MEDEATFLKEFSALLEGLTFNSGPVISQLARSSEEHIGNAQQIVDLVENRLEKCLPKHKLYTFYVLDSICKNVGRPYTIFFQRNLPKLFKQTYLIVDNETRQKLINVFKTWLNANSSFDEDEYDSGIFDKEVLKNIESFLIKASAVHEKNSKKTNSINFQPPTIPGLLKEIDRLIVLCNDKVNLLQQRLNTALASVNSSAVYNHAQHQQMQQLQGLIMEEINSTQPKIMVLQELKKEIMKGTMPVEALVQVEQQLRANFQKEHQELMKLHTPPSTQNQRTQQQQQHQQIPVVGSVQPANSLPSQMGSIFGDEHPISTSESSGLPTQPITNIFGDASNYQGSISSNADENLNATSSSSLGSVSILKDLEQLKLGRLKKLVEKLKDSDLIKEPDTEHSILTIWDKFCKDIPLDNNTRLDASIRNLPDINVLQHIVKDLNSSKIDVSYFINSPNFKLDNKQINENYASVFPFIQLLYRYKPEKCSSCGKRYHTTTNLMNFMNNTNTVNTSIHDHLDWHFRINKRINLNKGRASLASRSWYMDDEQWINSNPSNENNNQNVDLDMDKLTSLTNYNNKNNNTDSNNNKRGYGDDEHASMILGPNSALDTKLDDSSNYMTSVNDIHKKHKNYKAMYIIIPDSLISTQVECQICKDSLQATYNENIGQWVWSNCVENNKQYFHATCFYESKK